MPTTATFSIRETSGISATNFPVTLSCFFAKGHVRGHFTGPLVKVNGAGIPSQCDVQGTWDDGSIRHALVSFKLSIIGNTTKSVTVEDAPGIPPPPMTIVVPQSDLTLWYEMTLKNGESWLANMKGGQLVIDYAKQVSRDFKPLLSGQIVNEVEISGPLKKSGALHPNLSMTMRWRVFDGWNGARIEFVAYNTPLPAAGAPKADDYEFTKATIRSGADDSAHEVFAAPAGILWDQTFFAHRFWVGADKAPDLVIRQDLKYLVENGFFPPYDYTAPISDVDCEAWAKNYWNKFKVNTTFPLGIPLNSGPVEKAMGNTGDRDDIGNVPRWTAYSLNSNYKRASLIMEAADANSCGAFPIWVRDPDTGAMGVKYNDKRWNGGKGPRGNRISCPNTYGVHHSPAWGYGSYLVEGDRLRADILSGTACVAPIWYPYTGTLPYKGSRHWAWGMRNLYLAYLVLPDAHPLRAYFKDRVDVNYSKVVGDTTDPKYGIEIEDAATICASGRGCYAIPVSSPWQDAWVAAVSRWIAKTTPHPDAKAMFEWFADYWIKAYVTKIGEAWKHPNGSTYTWDANDGGYATAYSCPPVNCLLKYDANGKVVEDSATRKPINNYALLKYSLRINQDYTWTGTATQPNLGALGTDPLLWPFKGGSYTEPTAVTSSWQVYAIHWLSAELNRSGLANAKEVYNVMKPLIDKEVKVAGLRMK